MSARVLNPAMMSEPGHRGVATGGGATRVAPSRVALARVRRDLFGPVDHAAARALAERELRAQSVLDAERWGFDFHLEKPRQNSRYEWEPVTSDDVVPEPYALRGMPRLRKNMPSDGEPRASRRGNADADATVETTMAATMAIAMATTTTTTTTTTTPPPPPLLIRFARNAERTPPQESRVPDIDQSEILGRDQRNSAEEKEEEEIRLTRSRTYRGKRIERIVGRENPTTPVLDGVTRMQQTSITDYMKSRKRALNGSTKSIVELPEKIARNAGQIRS